MYIIGIKSILLNNAEAKCIIYNNNWIKMIGRTATSPTTQIFNFVSLFGVVMRNVNYTVYLTPYNPGSGSGSETAIVRTKNVDSFSVGFNNTWTYVDWVVEDYAASITNFNKTKLIKTIKWS